MTNVLQIATFDIVVAAQIVFYLWMQIAAESVFTSELTHFQWLFQWLFIFYDHDIFKTWYCRWYLAKKSFW